jgi:hypothetical protein
MCIVVFTLVSLQCGIRLMLIFNKNTGTFLELAISGCPFAMLWPDQLIYYISLLFLSEEVKLVQGLVLVYLNYATLTSVSNWMGEPPRNTRNTLNML